MVHANTVLTTCWPPDHVQIVLLLDPKLTSVRLTCYDPNTVEGTIIGPVTMTPVETQPMFFLKKGPTRLIIILL
jgi:hypothetical protein